MFGHPQGFDPVGEPLQPRQTPPDLAAVLATTAEHVLPILLLLGIATRLSALGLLGMTMVIQLFVFPEAWWSVHIIWVAMCLVILSRGSGMIALDPPVWRRAHPG